MHVSTSVAQVSIFNLRIALVVSALAHSAAIAWVHTHPSATPTPARTAQPVVEIVDVVDIAPAAEPAPMVVALLPDHSVVAVATAPGPTTARSRTNRGNRIETAPVAAISTGTEIVTAPTETGTGTKRHPLLGMRGPSIEAGPSASFQSQFLASSRPLPAEVPRSGELRPDGQGTKSEHQTFRIKVAADGTVDIHDKANWQQKSLFSAEFDVTDAMMRRQGMDPYASYKLKVLDETREERVAIGKTYRTQQLARSKQLAQKNLDRLWSSTLDLAARKQGLFELWDDCAESGSDERVVAGRSAREHVVGFIRGKLPAGTADAFTADELARFNRQRKSQATFAPYL